MEPVCAARRGPSGPVAGIPMHVRVACGAGTRGPHASSERDSRRRGDPTEITVSVTHSTRDAAGHHHADCSVRLPGGQSAYVVSHAPDYDGMCRGPSTRTVRVAQS